MIFGASDYPQGHMKEPTKDSGHQIIWEVHLGAFTMRWKNIPTSTKTLESLTMS